MPTLSDFNRRVVAGIEADLSTMRGVRIRDVDFGELTRPSVTDLFVFDRVGSVDICLAPGTVIAVRSPSPEFTLAGSISPRDGTRLVNAATVADAFDKLRRAVASTPIISRLSNYSAVERAMLTSVPVADPDEISGTLREHIRGQDSALDTLAIEVAAHLNMTPHAAPTIVVLMGDSGTGKTESFNALEHVMPGYDPVVVDLATFKSESGADRLFGSAPGYIKGEGVADKLAGTKNKRTRVLWDEAEKANPAVLQTLLGVMQSGRFPRAVSQDSVDVRDSFWLFTTNIGASQISAEIDRENAWDDPVRMSAICRAAALDFGWSLPFCGRVGQWIAFRPLSLRTRLEIAAVEINKLACRFRLNVTYVAKAALFNLMSDTGGTDIGARTDLHAVSSRLKVVLMQGQAAKLAGPLALIGPPFALVPDTPELRQADGEHLALSAPDRPTPTNRRLH